MIKEFKILFRIALRHNFYADGLGRHLVLEPSSETKSFMRRYDLHWRPDGHEFVLLYGQESGRQPALSYLNANGALRFYLQSKNPYFFNITAIPFLDGYFEKLYFHNLGEPAADAASVSLAVSAMAGAADVLPASSFSQPDLKGSDLGICDIYIGREGNGMIAPPAPNAQMPAPAAMYHIAFEARATRWRYYVVNRSQLPFERIDVVDGKTTMDFVNEAPRMLRSGAQIAIPVSSKSALTLREQPQVKPKLKLVGKEEAGAANGNYTTIDLPTPDWRNISPEGKGAELQVYSDMYVFL